MGFELHSEAERHFNELAEGLLEDFGSLTLPPDRAVSFRPQIHPVLHLTEQDIISDIEGSSENQRYVYIGDGVIGLQGKACSRFRDIAREIQRSKNIRDCLSEDFVQACLFHWLKERFTSGKGSSFVDYLTARGNDEVRNLELWFPLAGVQVQSDLQLGRVVFKTLAPQLFDNYEKLLLARCRDEEKADIAAVISRDRKDFQGHAAAVVHVRAERIHALQLGYREAEFAVSMLRFFHPANLLPFGKSFCTLAGEEHLRKSATFVFCDDRLLSINRRVVDSGLPGWALDNQWIAYLRKVGLDLLDQILQKVEKSPFERDLIAAIRVYSKNSLSDATEDKLVYVFAALESLLLKNRSEPVTKNIGERIAFLIGDSIEKRRQTIKNIDSVYDRRSQFVHHGRSVDNEIMLEEFMLNAWTCMVTLVDHSKKFRTRAELIEALENRKLS